MAKSEKVVDSIDGQDAEVVNGPGKDVEVTTLNGGEVTILSDGMRTRPDLKERENVRDDFEEEER